MVTIRIKGGTPQGAETLCVTCRWAHIVKGFGVSQEEIRSSFARGWRVDPIEAATFDVTLDPAGVRAWRATITRI